MYIVQLILKMRSIIFCGQNTKWDISRDISMGPRLLWPRNCPELSQRRGISRTENRGQANLTNLGTGLRPWFGVDGLDLLGVDSVILNTMCGFFPDLWCPLSSTFSSRTSCPLSSRGWCPFSTVVCPFPRAWPWCPLSCIINCLNKATMEHEELDWNVKNLSAIVLV